MLHRLWVTAGGFVSLIVGLQTVKGSQGTRLQATGPLTHIAGILATALTDSQIDIGNGEVPYQDKARKILQPQPQ